MPQQNAADTCAKMRRTADGERIYVEWSLLEHAESSAMKVRVPRRIS